MRPKEKSKKKSGKEKKKTNDKSKRNVLVSLVTANAHIPQREEEEEEEESECNGLKGQKASCPVVVISKPHRPSPKDTHTHTQRNAVESVKVNLFSTKSKETNTFISTCSVKQYQEIVADPT